MDQNLRMASGQHAELRRRLLLEDPDLDEVTLADTLEGLTCLHEILIEVVKGALLDEAYASGLRERIAQMEERLRRFDERALTRRHLARDVMVEHDIKKLLDPEFTISIRQGSRSVVVIDEGAIPAHFWEMREPRLNRQAVLAELRTGASLPGVELSNAEPVLSVRTR